MRIEGTSNPLRSSSTSQRSEAVRQKKAVDRPQDGVELSSVSSLAAKVKTSLEEITPSLKEIRSRVSSGHYDTPEAKKKTAEALLKSGNFQQVAKDAAVVKNAKSQLAQTPDVRADRVAQARQKMESGFYDSPEVRRQTAGKILDGLS